MSLQDLKANVLKAVNLQLATHFSTQKKADVESIIEDLTEVIHNETPSGQDCAILCGQNEELIDLYVTHDDIDDELRPRAICVAAVRKALKDFVKQELNKDERIQDLGGIEVIY